jgi:glycosyltransferase involved in cell wall biosynthesis
VNLHPVPPSGGDNLRDKFGVLVRAPSYLFAVYRALKKADVVHIRCPANISLLALLLLTVKRRPICRWIKYAGNWRPSGTEPFSYRFQRWWLTKNLVRGVVTVNGRWADQPTHVRTFVNPCLTKAELEEARNRAASKVLAEPIRLLFVGRVEEPKGVRVVVEIAAKLKSEGVPFALDIVGDGPARVDYERWSVEHELTGMIHWHGWKPRPNLNSFYAQAHFLLLPSAASEGFPKVVGEAMSHGTVPLASAISSIPQLLQDAGVGQGLIPDSSAYIRAIESYLSEPKQWHSESQAAVTTASTFTYDRYVRELQRLIGDEC